MDPLDQLGHAIDGCPDGHAVVGEHDQPRAPVAYLVGHVERSTRERNRLEDFAREYPPDAVVEFGTRVGGVDMLLFAADDLAQICLGQEAHRGARAVIEVGGVRHEPLARPSR